MNVIPFPRQPRQRFPEPVSPPRALGAESGGGSGGLSAESIAEEAFEDRRRMQQNLAALALVLVLVVLGMWMIERLRVYARTMACIEYGHRSCTVVDPRRLPTR